MTGSRNAYKRELVGSDMENVLNFVFCFVGTVFNTFDVDKKGTINANELQVSEQNRRTKVDFYG